MPAPRPRAASPLLTQSSPPPALVSLVLASLRSPDTRRSYDTGIAALYRFKGGRPLTPGLLHEWRDALQAARTSGTVNARFTAIRKFLDEARRAGYLTEPEAAPLLRVKGLPYLGARAGNWLTVPQVRALLAVPSRATLIGMRNYCILALLLGTAIRVSELAALNVRQIQKRDGRWAIVDILKKRHMRTVAIPAWVMESIAAWMKAAAIDPKQDGPLLRQVSIRASALTERGLLYIVRNAAAAIGIRNIGPHDLRRTCARRMWAKGEPIEQIQIMLGHADIRTTMRYLGNLQSLAKAPNDDLGF